MQTREEGQVCAEVAWDGVAVALQAVCEDGRGGLEEERSGWGRRVRGRYARMGEERRVKEAKGCVGSG